MAASGRSGPKPKRLYVRVVRFDPSEGDAVPEKRSLRAFIEQFDRVGRLVAHGALSNPSGDFLVFRAVDRMEADRVLRTDPLKRAPGAHYEILEWSASGIGAGVNLEPPPARGSGRLTLLERIPVVVSDQRWAIDWYREVLGLKVLHEDADTQYVELALSPGAAALSLIAPRREWGEPYYSESMARMGIRTGIVFQTDSVDALELRLRHAGARITRSVESQPWGERTIVFSDPDGNEFLAYDRQVARPSPPTAGVIPRKRAARAGRTTSTSRP